MEYIDIHLIYAFSEVNLEEIKDFGEILEEIRNNRISKEVINFNTKNFKKMFKKCNELDDLDFQTLLIVFDKKKDVILYSKTNLDIWGMPKFNGIDLTDIISKEFFKMIV